MRIVFCGTPDFAIPSLRAVSEHFDVVGVFTQPDRGNRRGTICPPVKVEAQKLGLKVFQCENISKDGFETLKSLEPDCIVTCAFGHFLYRKVLALPKYGVINVHGSLLPKYRGASPIQSAVLNGEKESGVAIMRTEFEMDSGDILLMEKTPIAIDETSGELFDRLAVIGAETLVKGLKMIEDGTAVFTPQQGEPTFCEKFTKEYGLLSFDKTPEDIRRLVFGLNPWPSAYTYLPDGKLFKIHKIVALDKQYDCANGTVVSCDSKNGIIVSCEGGSIRLTEVQEEGGKKMDAESFILGHDLKGIVFNSNK